MSSTDDATADDDIGALRKQVEQLSAEVLDQYRHVNLLYRLGDSINTGLGRDDICRLVLKESLKIVRARAGHLQLEDGTAFGRPPPATVHSISVPIETPQGRLGVVTVYEKRSGDFTASDGKLIRAVARQAGIAIENSKLIEGLISQNTELERLNVELKALDQLKSDFVSNVSHELRTPLASIKGFAATILDDPEMPDEVLREFVGIIDDESDKLIFIINDILDISKIMSGHMNYELRDQPFERTVEAVVALLDIQARKKGLALIFDLIDPVIARFDHHRMSQVLTNIVGNAIKFTDTGSVRLTQWLADDELHLAVTDTGIGISDDQLPHIFDKFYRVENVVHTKEGTGLGLALVRTIVEHHGGRIEVVSREGEGSTFTVHLPMHAPELGTS